MYYSLWKSLKAQLQIFFIKSVINLKFGLENK